MPIKGKRVKKRTRGGADAQPPARAGRHKRAGAPTHGKAKVSGPGTSVRRSVRPSRRPAAERIGEIITRLERQYPEARCSLDHADPLQLLVATILSAQCTDARVNVVTKDLFRKYRSAGDYAAANPAVFEGEIRSTGFFRNKTKSVIGMAQALVERFDGRVPDSMEALTTLPGVGRKTANVVLGNAFGKDEGIVVDTHVARIAKLLALTRQSDPVKIEQDLMQVVPRRRWTLFAHLLIHHGRQICIARRPRCEVCPLADLCPSAAV
jgi:endonuclease III